jgi:flagellar biosynthetic protein FlhB
VAEQDRDQRTEQATPKRIEDARRRGEVPRSRDLTSAAVLLAAGAGLYALGGVAGGQLAAMMRDAFTFTRAEALDEAVPAIAFGRAVGEALLICAPLLGLMLVAALLAPLSIGGWNFSSEALAPKWERLDPVAGIRRIFSLVGLFELAKSLARFAVVGGTGALVLWIQSDELLALGREPLALAIGHAMGLAGMALIALAGSMVLIAAVDAPFALWQHRRSLRMTRQEVRDELRENEGNPEVRGKIRARQQALARSRMMQEVPRADVVVTNPTHYAVALRYDESRSRAPVVVAKGRDLVAARIRAVAAEHGVPLLEAPPLARALHAACELGEEIPARLYAAVAQVLAYVYQLRAARQSGAPPPQAPSIGLPADD